MTTVVQMHEIPDEIEALAPPAGYDYVDLFGMTAARSSVHAAEDWARAALEDAPRLGRFLAWTAACQLRLDARRSPEVLAGWKITGRGDGWITMDAAGWFMTGRMALHVIDDGVLFATFVRYENPVGRFWWPKVAAIHRRVVPNMLLAARGRIKRASRDVSDAS